MWSHEERKKQFFKQSIGELLDGYPKPIRNNRRYLKAMGNKYGVYKTPIVNIQEVSDCPDVVYRKIRGYVMEFFIRMQYYKNLGYKHTQDKKMEVGNV